MTDPIKEMYEKQKQLEAEGHEVLINKEPEYRSKLLNDLVPIRLLAGFSVSFHKEPNGPTTYILAWRKKF